MGPVILGHAGSLRVDVGTRPGRRRRPSGTPPPLPRPIFRSGKVYVALVAAVLVAWLAAMVSPTVARAVERGNVAVDDVIGGMRRDTLTDLAGHVEAVLGSAWAWRVMRWATLLMLLAVRRFRHLLVYLTVTLFVTNAASLQWSSLAAPSEPVAALGLSLVGAMYTLLPRGRRRNQAKRVAGVVMAVLVVASLYGGSVRATDVVVALALGMAVPVLAFRTATPHEAFPIRYGRISTAHLDLGTARVEAIRRAVEADLGCAVVAVEPLRLAGSSGSTPLRITVRAADGAVTPLFGKLYALSHLRADRWYKLGRSLLYGRLEDEHSLASVRRLVEHEDYSLRVAEAAGVPVPHSLGFVELTPEREYLLLTDWIGAARQFGGEPVTIETVDQALAIVKGLWAAGLAHRDIKPANLLLTPRGVWLVDLSFAELRPSPWREAVDLANVMLTLGVAAPAALVYERATQLFAPDEIGEAFAATGSVTMPAQLRSVIHARRPGLVAEFRTLAPPRLPISVQRWSLARLLLTAAAAAGAGGAVLLLVLNLGRAGLL